MIEYIYPIQIISDHHLTSRQNIKLNMSTQANNQSASVERGAAERVAWTFAQGSNLKPTLMGFKHSPLLDHEVRVRVMYFGVGDRHLYNQSDSQSNGLQVVGVVEAIGLKVGMRKVGDTVGVGLIRQSCKNCKICWSGKQELCKSVKNSYNQSAKEFSSHVNVPADWTFPIPKNIPLPETAPLLYSGVSAYNIVSAEYQRLKLEHSRKLRLAVLGVGSIGHMTAKFGAHLGYEVTIFSENPSEQQFLTENGLHFDAFVSLNLDNVGKHALKFDVVVVATAISKQVAKKSIELPRRNGKLVFLTHSINEVGISGFSLVVDQKEVTGVRNGTKDNFYKMLQLVAHVTSEKNRSLLPICEHFSFTEIERALSKVESSTARYQCVVKIEEDLVSKFNKNEL